jgi:hypothetical protein
MAEGNSRYAVDITKALSRTVWVHRQEDGTLRAIAGPDHVVLRTPVPCRGENLTTVGEFTVDEGDIVPFTWSYAPLHLPPPEPVDPRAALEATEPFWSEWSARARLKVGGWRDAVMRSLITLKALTNSPTGGIVASPTTSLPETIGGIRTRVQRPERFPWLAGGRRRDPLGIKCTGLIDSLSV